MITAKLTRSSIGCFGALGELVLLSGLSLATCERAFQSNLLENSWETKIPPGTYKCVKGTHQLEHGGPFTAFEITGVPGHTGLLFHIGNTYKDSEGCVLLGVEHTLNDALPFITESGLAFNEFMHELQDVNDFMLEVCDVY